jgi:ferredoxin-nitrite reductase
MSIKRVAESVDLNLWIPATVEASVDLTAAILRIFRDEGGRKDRQKGRLMWLIEDYGEVKEVKGHPQASEAFRKRVVKEMSTKAEKAQPKATAPFERRSLLGVHSQPQAGKSRVGVHVPVGRLSVAEARQIADLADRYSGGEVRLTVEQNVILPNVEDSALQALLAEPSLNGASRLSVEPGNIVGNVVSCTGAQFCGLAMIETKGPAEIVSRDLQKRVTVPKALRIHWTGCPNSCGQV